MATFREIVVPADCYLDFPSLRAARSFARGYCVGRVIVDTTGAKRRPRCARPLGRFLIVAPATAARNDWRVVS